MNLPDVNPGTERRINRSSISGLENGLCHNPYSFLWVILIKCSANGRVLTLGAEEPLSMSNGDDVSNLSYILL